MASLGFRRPAAYGYNDQQARRHAACADGLRSAGRASTRSALRLRSHESDWQRVLRGGLTWGPFLKALVRHRWRRYVSLEHYLERCGNASGNIDAENVCPTITPTR